VMVSTGLKIDWTQMPTYNTIMAVSAGAALLTLVWFGRSLLRKEVVHLEGWSLAFAVPGVILTLTGLHMTLTWPFAKYFPFDNIIFGEPSLAFGVLLLAGALYLWKRSAVIEASGDRLMRLSETMRPLSIFIFGMGLALGAIAIAGLVFQLFAAPPEEPISGAFANYPWVEAIFMSGLFGIIGVGAVLFPFALPKNSQPSNGTLLQRIIAILWGLGGFGLLVFGALNYFTHIGLILHTM
jgi:uncharacterized membrane protein